MLRAPVPRQYSRNLLGRWQIRAGELLVYAIEDIAIAHADIHRRWD